MTAQNGLRVLTIPPQEFLVWIDPTTETLGVGYRRHMPEQAVELTRHPELRKKIAHFAAMLRREDPETPVAKELRELFQALLDAKKVHLLSWPEA